MTAFPAGAELHVVAPGVRAAPGALRFAASRSSGPGGQNVNKVSTRIELRVTLSDLPISRAALDRLRQAAGRKVNALGELVLASDEHRSQLRNREECLSRLRELIVRALTPPKPRRPTKPTAASRRRRAEAKSRRSATKKGRGAPPEASGD